MAEIDFDKADELAAFYGTLVTPAESLAENPVFNLAAAYLSLRAPKGELEEARAELGAWLVANPGYAYRFEEPMGTNPWHVKLSDGRIGHGGFFTGTGPTEAAAIRAALSRARGEGT